MAYTQNHILNRLAGIEQTNFEVVDVKAKDSEIIWSIRHRRDAVYKCKYCGLEHTSFHDKRWIKIKDHPFGNKRCIWQVERMRILCTCTTNVRIEEFTFSFKTPLLNTAGTKV